MWMVDRLANLISGLGTAKDKGSYSSFNHRLVNSLELEAMYRCDWLSRKIIDIIPFDMTREWRSWKATDDEIEILEDVERKLQVQQKVAQAMQKARLYGGAGIYVGIKGAAPSSELLPETVAKDSLEFLHVFTNQQLTAEEWDNDITSIHYGEPLFYKIQSKDGAREVRIHRSRIVRFIGAPIPNATFQTSLWGDPILQVVYDAVRDATSAPAHIAGLLPEMKVDVITVPGLSDLLATPEGTARVTSRFAAANTMKSMFNVTLLEGGAPGEGEEWQQKTLSFAGFPDLIASFLQIAAGAADIPVTRLLGQSPKGLNSTGDADIRNYYDNLASKQEMEMRPALTQLDEVIIRSALGSRPPEIWYDFVSLWQLSAKEQADIGKVKADTVKVINDTGLVAPEALSEAFTNQLIEDGLFPGLEQALAEAPEIDFTEPEPIAGIDPLTGKPLKLPEPTAGKTLQ